MRPLINEEPLGPAFRHNSHKSTLRDSSCHQPGQGGGQTITERGFPAQDPMDRWEQGNCPCFCHSDIFQSRKGLKIPPPSAEIRGHALGGLGPGTVEREHYHHPVGWGCSKTGLDHPVRQAD